MSCSNVGRTKIEMRVVLEINSNGTEITHTGLDPGLAKEFIQPLVEQGHIPFLALFRRCVHITDTWCLRLSASTERSVNGGGRDAHSSHKKFVALVEVEM